MKLTSPAKISKKKNDMYYNEPSSNNFSSKEEINFIDFSSNDSNFKLKSFKLRLPKIKSFSNEKEKEIKSHIPLNKLPNEEKISKINRRGKSIFTNSIVENALGLGSVFDEKKQN